jgi:ribosomal protein L3
MTRKVIKEANDIIASKKGATKVITSNGDAIPITIVEVSATEKDKEPLVPFWAQQQEKKRLNKRK